MKFDKSKCLVLHLAWGNLGSVYKVGDKSLKISPTERDLGVLADCKRNVSQQCALTAQRDPGVHRTQHCHREKGGVVLLCSVLCGLTSCTGCSVGATTSGGHKAMRQHPMNGYKHGEAEGRPQGGCSSSQGAEGQR